MMAVWLAAAAACAAIWWALRVWAGPRLALLGGLATAVHPTMLGWSQVYHGGELAAFAGALLFAAAGVLRQRSSWRGGAAGGGARGRAAGRGPGEGAGPRAGEGGGGRGGGT